MRNVPAAKARSPLSGLPSSKRQSTISQSGAATCGASSAAEMSLRPSARARPWKESADCAAPSQSCSDARGLEEAGPWHWKTARGAAACTRRGALLGALEYKQLSNARTCSKLREAGAQGAGAPEDGSARPRAGAEGRRYVCFESLAILDYLDPEHPEPPLFGDTAEEAARSSA